MPYILSAIAVVVLVYAFYQWLRNQMLQPDPALRRKALMRAGFLLLVSVVLILTLTGRLHWIGALLAALIPVAKYLLTLGLRLIPFFASRMGAASQQAPTASNDVMGREDALKVLGLNEDASDDDIVDAHRKLMQKVHPDRGGSDDLAARINEAKRVLLG
jgi:hypothetical protein